jgi:hypothetical protein
LVVAAASTGQLNRNKNLGATHQTAPKTIQADFPAPSCPPACALPTPASLPE